jgi:hypothetical protein
VTVRRALRSTRDGAAIGVTAGRLAGMSASVDLLATVPPLVAELPPALALGAGPPDVELLGALADRVADRAAGHEPARIAGLPAAGGGHTAAAARLPVPADGRATRLGVAAAVDASTETPVASLGDDHHTVRRLSPPVLLERALSRLDGSRRDVLDRRVSAAVVAAAAVAGGPPRRTAGLPLRSARVSQSAPDALPTADLGHLQPATSPPTAGGRRSPAPAQASFATAPDAAQPGIADAGATTLPRPGSADPSERAHATLAGSGDVPRRLADLPRAFATETAPAAAIARDGDHPPVPAADRNGAVSPTPAFEAAALEELLEELLAREAEAHGLDGRLT